MGWSPVTDPFEASIDAIRNLAMCGITAEPVVVRAVIRTFADILGLDEVTIQGWADHFDSQGLLRWRDIARSLRDNFDAAYNQATIEELRP